MTEGLRVNKVDVKILEIKQVNAFKAFIQQYTYDVKLNVNGKTVVCRFNAHNLSSQEDFITTLRSKLEYSHRIREALNEEKPFDFQTLIGKNFKFKKGFGGMWDQAEANTAGE